MYLVKWHLRASGDLIQIHIRTRSSSSRSRSCSKSQHHILHEAHGLRFESL